MNTRLALASTLAALAAACSTNEGEGPTADGNVDDSSVAMGLETVIEGLNNPSSVSFSDDGRLTVCAAGPGRDGGNGRVIVWKDGEAEDYVTDLPTEYWKIGKDGAPDRFKLGPLGAAWASDGRLVVSNGGLADGADHLLVFTASGTASDGTATNPVPPTSDDPADKGEGNFTGMAVSADGERVWVCGQGADAKSWLLVCDIAKAELAGFASADDAGISTNSPMAALPWGDDAVLVLYSGAGGKDDGLLVKWDVAKREPVSQWSLAGLFDPMGMARIPGTDDLAVVDNNWDLTSVKEGRLARVALPANGGPAEVTMLREDLRGPTSCAFGPDGRLYVSLLGPEFDAEKGSVIAFSGIR